METIWLRVLSRPLIILLLGLASYMVVGVFVPAQLFEVSILAQVAVLSENAAPIVLVGFVLWAMISFVSRYWQVKQWQAGRASSCHRCGGPTIAKSGKRFDYSYCFQCEKITRI